MAPSYDSRYGPNMSDLGRAILRYLMQLQLEYGQRNAAYRKVRIDLLRQVDAAKGAPGGFNWGFEAVFTQELHILEELGLISVKYGSGAIMAGRTRSQIYNLSLTEDGMETARIIIDRETAQHQETDQAETGLAAAPTDREDAAQESSPEDSTFANLTEADTIVGGTPLEPPPEPPSKPSTAEIAPTGKLEPPRKPS